MVLSIVLLIISSLTTLTVSTLGIAKTAPSKSLHELTVSVINDCLIKGLAAS